MTFHKHTDPGLPTFPMLMVNTARTEAYIKLRIAEWRSVERARYATKGAITLHAIAVVVSTWLMLPPSAEMATHVVITVVVSAVSIALSAPVMRKILPGFLARQVFARRLKIACTAEWLAFKSWYWQNGIKISRSTGQGTLSIQPVVEEDPEAKAEADSQPSKSHAERRASRRHLSQASVLSLLLRTGSKPSDLEQLSAGRKFRTLPVAGMDKKLAERLVVLIDAAMELTAPNTRRETITSEGRDLDLKSTYME